jgi:hypothetical protein
MNEKLKRIQKEHILVYFTVLSRHMPGQTEENHKALRTTGNTAKILTAFLSSSCFEHYHYTNHHYA